MATKLKNNQVKSSGEYVMTRTDDDDTNTVQNIVIVVEYMGEYYVHPYLETPITDYDEECRWAKVVHTRPKSLRIETWIIKE
jgi:hypothetical protein